MAAELDQLLEVARERDVAFLRGLRLLHRAREVEELDQVAADVGRIGEHQLDRHLEDLLELVGPGAHERLAGGDLQHRALQLHRQDPVALGIGVRHRAGHRLQVDLQRVDVPVTHAKLAGQPFDQPFERHRRVRRFDRLQLLRGDELQRVLVLPRAHAGELVRLRHRNQAVDDHQLEDVLDAQSTIAAAGRIAAVRGGLDAGSGRGHGPTINRRPGGNHCDGPPPIGRLLHTPPDARFARLPPQGGQRLGGGPSAN